MLNKPRGYVTTLSDEQGRPTVAELVAGLSKLARTVEVFARRPQIQEHMTAQLADALEEYLKP